MGEGVTVAPKRNANRRLGEILHDSPELLDIIVRTKDELIAAVAEQASKQSAFVIMIYCKPFLTRLAGLFTDGTATILKREDALIIV